MEILKLKNMIKKQKTKQTKPPNPQWMGSTVEQRGQRKELAKS